MSSSVISLVELTFLFLFFFGLMDLSHVLSFLNALKMKGYLTRRGGRNPQLAIDF
jgi:hypothetical protein